MREHSGKAKSKYQDWEVCLKNVASKFPTFNSNMRSPAVRKKDEEVCHSQKLAGLIQK